MAMVSHEILIEAKLLSLNPDRESPFHGPAAVPVEQQAAKDQSAKAFDEGGDAEVDSACSEFRLMAVVILNEP